MIGSSRSHTSAALVVACTAAVSIIAPAAAAGSPATCRPTSHQVVFGLTRSTASWTVPVGVRTITAHVAGASGGNSGVFVNGGKGGAVAATVPVTPGTKLSLVVGAAGTDTANGTGPVYGGGAYNGGGGSFVFSGGRPVVVAGGGGAGGYTYSAYPTTFLSSPGGAGGAGGNGANSTGGGTGATTKAPGVDADDPSTRGSGPATGPTALGVGGTSEFGGNSGGGGYYGGGGGVAAGGSAGGVNFPGGGGSGYLAAGVVRTATGTRIGDGRITIVWSTCGLPS